MKIRPTIQTQSDLEAHLAQWGPLALDSKGLFDQWSTIQAQDTTDTLLSFPWDDDLRAADLVFMSVTVNGVPNAYVRAEPKAAARSGQRGRAVAIIPVVGVVTPFQVPWIYKIFGIRMASLPEIVGAARAAANDPEVGRIVLAIHSPGGSISGVPEAFAALREVDKVKPLHASVNYMAASAAYWLAAAAREIVATPSALVGSIGAKIRHVSIQKALDMEGVVVTDISNPDSKTDWSEVRDLTETARAEITRLVDDAYKMFKRDISSSRALDFAENGNQYGRVVPARDALKLKLIDRVTTFDKYLNEGQQLDLATETRRATLALLQRRK